MVAIPTVLIASIMLLVFQVMAFLHLVVLGLVGFVVFLQLAFVLMVVALLLLRTTIIVPLLHKPTPLIPVDVDIVTLLFGFRRRLLAYTGLERWRWNGVSMMKSTHTI